MSRATMSDFLRRSGIMLNGADTSEGNDEDAASAVPRTVVAQIEATGPELPESAVLDDVTVLSPSAVPFQQGLSTSAGSDSVCDSRDGEMAADVRDQALLRRRLLEIQSDSSCPDREKARRMQALLASKYLNVRERRPSSESRARDSALSEVDLATTFHNEVTGVMGCAHYQRNCKLQCSTCSMWATCRFCHNEHDGIDHELVRQETKNMLCMFCKTVQPAQQHCRHCNKRMASYFCAKCKLWDNDPAKNIYHCNSCGICRVGLGLGKDFFHCDRCNVCMAMALQDHHKCIERSTECDCPICGEYMFSSTQTVVFMLCGHSIHQRCYYDHVKTNYRCPTCSKSLRNMEGTFRMLDHQIALQHMPLSYKDTTARISCNDCGSKSTVAYHFLGHKCTNCMSYNTVILSTSNHPHE